MINAATKIKGFSKSNYFTRFSICLEYKDDFESVLKSGRLKNGLPWTIPIILDVEEPTAN